MVDKLQMDKLINDFGKGGLRFLFLFKVFKQRLQDELKREGGNFRDESKLNQICANATRELLINDEETPTEEEISKMLQCLKEKLNIRK